LVLERPPREIRLKSPRQRKSVAKQQEQETDRDDGNGKDTGGVQSTVGEDGEVVDKPRPYLPAHVALRPHRILTEGRFYHHDTHDALIFEWSASTIRTRFQGSKISMHMELLKGVADYYAVEVDGQLHGTVMVPWIGVHEVVLADKLDPTQDHEVAIVKRTEATVTTAKFYGFDIGPEQRWLEPPPVKLRRIEVIGDSITCAYGAECPPTTQAGFSAETEDAYGSYASVAAREVGAEVGIVAWSGRGLVQNSDGSREGTLPKLLIMVLPSYDPELRFIYRDNPRARADAVAVNLLTNDAFPDPQDDDDKIRKHYTKFVTRLKGLYQDPHVFLCLGPMLNNSWPPGRPGVLDRMRSIIQAVADSFDDTVIFVEFPPQVDMPDYPPGCNQHPGAKMHQHMGHQLAEAMKTAMHW